MVAVAIFIGLLFIALAFILNEGNAKYLLAGYNTMSEESRKQVDIKTYLVFFKKFHLFLGVTLISIFLFLNFLIDQTVAGLFLTFYPLVLYVFFALKSIKLFGKTKEKKSKTAAVILIVTVLGVAVLVFYGFKKNQLVYENDHIEITGMYGETIQISDIRSIEVVSNLPEISYKINGFAIANSRKGIFESKNGSIKLFQYSDRQPFLYIRSNGNNPIYFQSDSAELVGLLSEVEMKLNRE